MAVGPLKKVMASAALGVMATGPLTGNAVAEDQTPPAATTVAAADAENVSFQTDRNFVIIYNPNSAAHSPSALEGTISDIHRAGCEEVGLKTKPFGAGYTLQAPWLKGHNVFNVDDLGTVGNTAIDLCEDGKLGRESGPV